MKKSEYAAKQGRAPSEKGKPASGRTRVAKTSPFSLEYKINPWHRLALFHERGEYLDRAQRARVRVFAR